MERLTKVINACGKTIVVYTRGKYEDTTAGEMEHKDIRNVMKRLSDYEETDLTPEQIRELKKRDVAKIPVDSDADMGYFVCPECGAFILADDFGDHKFCLNCGQRLEWEEQQHDNSEGN